MEHFKPIPGFDAIYEVSDLGTVRTIPRIDRAGKRRAVRVLKPSLSIDGYVRSNLSKDGKTFHIGTHRLVYMAFIGPIPDGHEINHLNGNRRDNRLENLSCITHAENVRYSKDVLKANYATYGNAKLSADEVQAIRELIAEGVSSKAIAAMFGIHSNSVWHIKSGKTWQSPVKE
jgi:hypothetical protein